MAMIRFCFTLLLFYKLTSFYFFTFYSGFWEEMNLNEGDDNTMQCKFYFLKLSIPMITSEL